MWPLILSLAFQNDAPPLRLSELPIVKVTVQPTLQYIEQRAKAAEWLDAGPAFPAPFISSDNGCDLGETLEAFPELSVQFNFGGWGLEAYYADMRQRFPETLGRDTNYDLHLFPAGRYDYDYLIRRYRGVIFAPPIRWSAGDREFEIRIGLGAEVLRIEFGLHGADPNQHEQVQGNGALVPCMNLQGRVPLAEGFEVGATIRAGLQPWQSDWPEGEGAHGHFVEFEVRFTYFLFPWCTLEFGPRVFYTELDFDGREDPISVGDNERQLLSLAFFAGLGLRY